MPDAEKDATRHDPTLCATGRYGCWSYCTCGWKSGLYTTTTGAHQAFGEHLTRVFPPEELVEPNAELGRNSGRPLPPGWNPIPPEGGYTAEDF